MSEPTNLDEAVLRHVTHPNYQPVKPRVIAKKLEVSREQLDELKRAIKRLIRAGRLMYGAGHLVKPVPAGTAVTNQIVGVFRRNAKGFGFVRPGGPSGGAAPAT